MLYLLVDFFFFFSSRRRHTRYIGDWSSDACYEIGQPDRYPVNESVNMAQAHFDLGIVHYASDTPYTQARTLGARGLSYRGMDSTYAAAIAVARRILQREDALVSQKK